MSKIINEQSTASSMNKRAVADNKNLDLDIARKFSHERDIHSYLAKNLDQIEPGLTLFTSELSSGINYPTGRKKIDILAKDKEGGLVVIKLSRRYDTIVDQILNHLNWIKKNLANSNQKIRGIIIARKITEDLKLACLYMPELTLMEYELSVDLKKISTGKNPLLFRN